MSTPPNAWTQPVLTASDVVWTLIAECPLCPDSHSHGGGAGPEPDLFGHRVAHCGGDGGYVLVPSGHVWRPKGAKYRCDNCQDVKTYAELERREGGICDA